MILQDLEFWLGEVEILLRSEDYGKDLASIENLLKKQQLLEADVAAHVERVEEMNKQVARGSREGNLIPMRLWER